MREKFILIKKKFQVRSEYEVEYIFEPITVGKQTGLTSRQCNKCSEYWGKWEFCNPHYVHK